MKGEKYVGTGNKWRNSDTSHHRNRKKTLKPSNKDNCRKNHPHSPTARYHLKEMERSYALLAHYDYREIPEEMFMEWIRALENNKEKYQNKKINNTFKPE